MEARRTLTILAELADLDAKRSRLLAELRRAVISDALDHAIATDPVLRDIFRPAEDLAERARILESDNGT